MKTSYHSRIRFHNSVESAGLAERAIAMLIDYLLVCVPLCVVERWLPAASTLFYGLAIGYLLLRDALPIGEGQGLGKYWMGIQVISGPDLKPIRGQYVKSVLRNLPMLVPVVNVVDLFVLLLASYSENSLQRLGDTLAKTDVVVRPVPTGGFTPLNRRWSGATGSTPRRQAATGNEEPAQVG